MEFFSGEKTLFALNAVNLHIPEGQFAAITGVSGSGKTTLLTLIAGLDTPTRGTVFLKGTSLSGLSEERVAWLRGSLTGFIFQSYQLIPGMTALENTMLPLELKGKEDAHFRAEELLRDVGLNERGSHYPSQLSGGEQQRVAIARAFACSPPIILADEPTGNLDSSTSAKIIELILRMHRTYNTTMLLVTHDQQLATLSDRVITLASGKVTSDTLAKNRNNKIPH